MIEEAAPERVRADQQHQQQNPKRSDGVENYDGNVEQSDDRWRSGGVSGHVKCSGRQ
jgi:hypothetical protein